MFALHARQQFARHIGLHLRLYALGRHARQVAELVDELAQLGDGVHRDAALDLVGRHGGEGHIKELVVRPLRLELIGNVADAADQPRRVFDGVRSLRR
ncbi:hypothetical protein SDC9_147992 [bioreactor metagenome]|uniref:Uncharacterized protein n=1 Tax=bioreactor metagenome TaxID=1076179 RepID=A0A645EJA8_9ZZZZ